MPDVIMQELRWCGLVKGIARCAEDKRAVRLERHSACCLPRPRFHSSLTCSLHGERTCAMLNVTSGKPASQQNAG